MLKNNFKGKPVWLRNHDMYVKQQSLNHVYKIGLRKEEPLGLDHFYLAKLRAGQLELGKDGTGAQGASRCELSVWILQGVGEARYLSYPISQKSGQKIWKIKLSSRMRQGCSFPCSKILTPF